MTTEFSHPKLGEEVRTIAGYYIPHEEHTLRYKGRELLYILGHACIDTSCCGAAAWSYIQVPGFLVRKHIRGGKTAPPVSEVEAISEPETRKEVTELLSREHPGTKIEIW